MHAGGGAAPHRQLDLQDHQPYRPSILFDSFKDIYARAYAMGCKGCTTYRPNEVTGSVLSVRPDGASPEAGSTSRPPQQAELPLKIRPRSRRRSPPMSTRPAGSST